MNKCSLSPLCIQNAAWYMVHLLGFTSYSTRISVSPFLYSCLFFQEFMVAYHKLSRILQQNTKLTPVRTSPSTSVGALALILGWTLVLGAFVLLSFRVSLLHMEYLFSFLLGWITFPESHIFLFDLLPHVDETCPLIAFWERVHKSQLLETLNIWLYL